MAFVLYNEIKGSFADWDKSIAYNYRCVIDM